MPLFIENHDGSRVSVGRTVILWTGNPEDLTPRVAFVCALDETAKKVYLKYLAGAPPSAEGYFWASYAKEPTLDHWTWPKIV